MQYILCGVSFAFFVFRVRARSIAARIEERKRERDEERKKTKRLLCAVDNIWALIHVVYCCAHLREHNCPTLFLWLNNMKHWCAHVAAPNGIHKLHRHKILAHDVIFSIYSYAIVDYCMDWVNFLQFENRCHTNDIQTHIHSHPAFLAPSIRHTDTYIVDALFTNKTVSIAAGNYKVRFVCVPAEFEWSEIKRQGICLQLN